MNIKLGSENHLSTDGEISSDELSTSIELELLDLWLFPAFSVAFKSFLMVAL